MKLNFECEVLSSLLLAPAEGERVRGLTISRSSCDRDFGFGEAVNVVAAGSEAVFSGVKGRWKGLVKRNLELQPFSCSLIAFSGFWFESEPRPVFKG